MYVAYNGKAYLNDKLISISNIKTPSEGVVCTGFPSYSSFKTDYLEKFVKKIQKWKKN